MDLSVKPVERAINDALVPLLAEEDLIRCKTDVRFAAGENEYSSKVPLPEVVGGEVLLSSGSELGVPPA